LTFRLPSARQARRLSAGRTDARGASQGHRGAEQADVAQHEVGRAAGGPQRDDVSSISSAAACTARISPTMPAVRSASPRMPGNAPYAATLSAYSPGACGPGSGGRDKKCPGDVAFFHEFFMNPESFARP
jgi:hypothetical protein